MLRRLRTYLALTKPTIMVLVVVTGATGLVLQGDFTRQPWQAVLVLLGLFLTGGSANALNQYFERDIDARMARTAKRRPLPTHRLGAREALVFAVGIGVLGVLLFALCFNLLSAALAGGTILFYGLFYTLYLKPRTAQNIVIGGAAGAMAPVIAWAAAANSLALTPWLLFLVIFLWTPPHFWALALYLREEYERVELPMMPVVAGEASTLWQMLWYTLATVVSSLVLVWSAGWWSVAGLLYTLVAAALGVVFLRHAYQAWRQRTRQQEIALFKFSILYLFGLFFAMIVVGMVQVVTN